MSLLRAWERRYGLFAPQRTTGGYRLYSGEDERRARRMLAHIARGVAAAESARIVLGELPHDRALQELAAGWDALDLARTHQALDGLLSGPEPERVAGASILPLLAHACERWEPAEACAGRTHFASRTLETRLLALGERWHEGSGPHAVLGCAPGEHHTLGPIVCGLALHRRGWRIAYLGQDAPLAAFESTAIALGAQRVIVSATMRVRLEPHLDELARIGRRVPLALAGDGAGDGLAARAGVPHLTGSPLDVALAVSLDGQAAAAGSPRAPAPSPAAGRGSRAGRPAH